MSAQMIGFNGFGYSIAKWLPTGAREEWRWNWSQRKARSFAETISRPTIGVGFSDGATAMSHIPHFTSHVRTVYLHSPLFERPWVNLNCEYRLFITRGDKTPTAAATSLLYEWLRHRGAAATFEILDFVPFARPTLMERFLANRRHIFHNLVPVLEQAAQTL